MQHRYPLSPLYQARQIAQDEAENLAAELARACARAQNYEVEVRQRLELARRSIAADAHACFLNAEHTTIAALDLQLTEQHRRAAELQIARLNEELNRAGLAVAQHRAACEKALQAAVRAREEMAVVERHRSRFIEQAEKTEEARTDEQTAEIWLAQQRASKAGS